MYWWGASKRQFDARKGNFRDLECDMPINDASMVFERYRKVRKEGIRLGPSFGNTETFWDYNSWSCFLVKNDELWKPPTGHWKWWRQSEEYRYQMPAKSKTLPDKANGELFTIMRRKSLGEIEASVAPLILLAFSWRFFSKSNGDSAGVFSTGLRFLLLPPGTGVLPSTNKKWPSGGVWSSTFMRYFGETTSAGGHFHHIATLARWVPHGHWQPFR